MEITHRNVSLIRLIDEISSKLADLAVWPESNITREGVDSDIKLLRKAFREDGYPQAFLYMAMCQIAHDVYSSTVNRNVKKTGLQASWMKISELLD